MKKFITSLERLILVMIILTGSIFYVHAEDWIPADAQVVLMTSLPGDVSSEERFSRETVAWIDWLHDKLNSEGKIIVLNSEIEKRFPDHREATRENWLTLGMELAERKKPVVFVVWGHGGEQKGESIFHVKGPRIGARDFEYVAGPLKGISTTWILFFSGSGGIGKVLAGENRRVISSEGTTFMRNEPVAMNVWLEGLRRGDLQDWEKRGVGFGSSLSDWYQERSLVRTEEPTFWNIDKSPRLLAEKKQVKGEKKTSLTESTGSGELNGKGGEEKSEPNEEKLLESRTDWSQYASVDPRSYPEFDGVELFREVKMTATEKPGMILEEDRVIQVMTEEGKRIADFEFNFNPPEEEWELLDAEIKMPSGESYRLPPEKIYSISKVSGTQDHSLKSRAFSFPGITPGSLLRVHFRREWKQFPFPHPLDEVELHHGIPVLQTKIEVGVPAGVPFHYQWFKWVSKNPEVRQSEQRTIYQWKLKEILPEPHETLTAHETTPALRWSTFKDWKEFASWYGRIIQNANDVTPEIQAKAESLTKNLKSDQEKVERIYRYVTSLRYIAMEWGVNSFRPHAAATTLSQGFGDCKDKANLLLTLLKSIGIKGNLVLVPRFSQASEELPGACMNHAIARIGIGKEVFWLDSTDDVCRFGMLPPGDPGRKVLVIDGKSEKLVTLEKPDPTKHQISLETRWGSQEGKKGSTVEVRAQTKGIMDYEFRSLGRSNREAAQNIPLLEMRGIFLNGFFMMDQQRFGSPGNLEEAFHLETQGRWRGGIPVWIPKEWMEVLHSRKKEVILNQGYPLQIEQRIFGGTSIPESWKRGIEGGKKYLKWKIQVEGAGEKEAVLFCAVLDQGEFTAEEIPLLQEELQDLLSETLASGTPMKVAHKP